MPRRKAKVSEDIVQIWHIDEHEYGSRYYKLIRALADESDFNDLFVTADVTDDEELLCISLSDN